MRKESNRAWLAASTDVGAPPEKSRAQLYLVPSHSPRSRPKAAADPYWKSIVGRLTSLRLRMAGARALTLLVRRQDARLLADAGLAPESRASLGDGAADIADRPRWLS